MLVTFSLLIVYGGVAARADHHTTPCSNVTTDCASNPTCNTILTRYQTDCMSAFTDTGCSRTCVNTAFKDLFTNPIGQKLHGCKCDSDGCSNFTKQCGRCAAQLTACAFDATCNAFYQDFLNKCKAVTTGCVQACTDSFTAGIQGSPLLAQLPECVCDAGDVICSVLKSALARCHTTPAPRTTTPAARTTTPVPRTNTNAPGRSQASRRTVTATPSHATERSVAMGALVIGVVAGALYV